MKCIIFESGDAHTTMRIYNDWAKNKVLAKDVIIHTHSLVGAFDAANQLMICVFYDEHIHPDWSN